MILTTHAIAGAAVAQFFPNRPVAGFLAGFVSHFLLDAIPHWDYKLLSLKEYQSGAENRKNSIPILTKAFGYDMIRVGLDFCLGAILALIIFTKADAATAAIWPTLAGALGATIPDPLTLLGWIIKKDGKNLLYRFHAGVHCQSVILDDRPFLGLLYQAVLASVLVFVVNCLT